MSGFTDAVQALMNNFKNVLVAHYEQLSVKYFLIFDIFLKVIKKFVSTKLLFYKNKFDKYLRKKYTMAHIYTEGPLGNILWCLYFSAWNLFVNYPVQQNPMPEKMDQPTYQWCALTASINITNYHWCGAWNQMDSVSRIFV